MPKPPSRRKGRESRTFEGRFSDENRPFDLVIVRPTANAMKKERPQKWGRPDLVLKRSLGLGVHDKIFWATVSGLSDCNEVGYA